LKPQEGQRQTACIRYISAAPQRSQTIGSSTGCGALSAESGRTGGRGGGGSAMGAIIACAFRNH